MAVASPPAPEESRSCASRVVLPPLGYGCVRVWLLYFEFEVSGSFFGCLWLALDYTSPASLTVLRLLCTYNEFDGLPADSRHHLLVPCMHAIRHVLQPQPQT